jgi:hypothetical protein
MKIEDSPIHASGQELRDIRGKGIRECGDGRGNGGHLKGAHFGSGLITCRVESKLRAVLLAMRVILGNVK